MPDTTNHPSADDARMIMRDAVAAKIHAFSCRECSGEGEPRFSDEQMADKVMELFADVAVEEWFVGERGTWPTSSVAATHVRYVLRIGPAPVRLGEARGDTDVSV